MSTIPFNFNKLCKQNGLAYRLYGTINIVHIFKSYWDNNNSQSYLVVGMVYGVVLKRINNKLRENYSITVKSFITEILFIHSGSRI